MGRADDRSDLGVVILGSERAGSLVDKEFPSPGSEKL
jgi:hypothetical protein